MENFEYQNTTKLIFGRGQVEALRTEVPPYGNKVLVVYGGGSIKRSGLYDQVMSVLQSAGLTVFEFGGVEPNPRVTTVNRAADVCKKEGIDFLLAVGGGSVIDCTKAIAAAAYYDGDAWDIVTGKTEVTRALPLGTILTLAATGSEMNSGSVITNWETQEKYGWGTPLVQPKFSILDPVNTFTVPQNQTIYGIVDMMVHVFEQYFSNTPNTPLQDRMAEAVLQTVIEAGPKLVNDLENYELRETILLSGTIALNGILSIGVQGDWATHNIEHAVSAVFDIPHGGGLAILSPNWMKHVLDDTNARKFAQFATRVFHVDPTGKTEREVALEGIDALRAFWNSIGAPSRLADYNIDASSIELMADKAIARGEFGSLKVLNRDDAVAILKASL